MQGIKDDIWFTLYHIRKQKSPRCERRQSFPEMLFNYFL
jgi:hypothetical protein